MKHLVHFIPGNREVSLLISYKIIDIRTYEWTHEFMSSCKVWKNYRITFGDLKLMRNRKWFTGFTLIQLCVYYSTVFLCLYFRIHNEEKHVAIKLCGQSNRRMKNRKHGSTFYNYEAIVVVLLSWADSSFFSFTRHMNKYDKKLTRATIGYRLWQTEKPTDRPTDGHEGS